MAKPSPWTSFFQQHLSGQACSVHPALVRPGALARPARSGTTPVASLIENLRNGICGGPLIVDDYCAHGPVSLGGFEKFYFVHLPT